ncbi:unnamed protein product [Durusdinium trenchii]|uniref:Aspartyl/asparaginy/proline hydroxylase domain-containing protein n=1 Tax=Durusdinium trenchii TaxID=1381693 RepID=A0ABP0PIZ8_9DINO
MRTRSVGIDKEATIQMLVCIDWMETSGRTPEPLPSLSDTALRNAKAVRIPEHVVTLGSWAFDRCLRMILVEIPNSGPSFGSFGPDTDSQGPPLAELGGGRGAEEQGNDSIATSALKAVKVDSTLGRREGQGPALQNAQICEPEVLNTECTSEDQPEPLVGLPRAGVRTRLARFQGLEYQLYLPSTWRDDAPPRTYPVVVFLHGAGDGKFSVMNSQSLPRLLTRNQSTCFDHRTCWCLPKEYERATAMKEAPIQSPEAFLSEEEDLWSPMASCNFAQTFPAITVMPQGWTVGQRIGWSFERLQKVKQLTQHVLQTYHGDPARVSLTGQSAGGAGAWRFAVDFGQLWSSVSVVCAPAPPQLAQELEGLPIWVIGDAGDGERGNDALVEALKRRHTGLVRYTRYTKAPPPPDPKYNFMLGHGSYDLIYRDPRLWQWALDQQRPSAVDAWKDRSPRVRSRCRAGEVPDGHKSRCELANMESKILGWLEPSCLEALLQRGLALLELGRPSAADHVLREGLQADGSAVLARSAPESQEVLDQLETYLKDEALLQQVQKLRETGNEHVRQGRYADASWCYEDCLQVLWGKDLIFPSEVKERAQRAVTGLWRQIRAAETAVLTNLSLCCLQGEVDWAPSPERAMQLCEIALTYDPDHVKDAEAVLTSAARKRPQDASLRQDLKRAQHRADEVRRKARDWEREAFRDLFERLPGFATPEACNGEDQEDRWPETQFPTPQKCLGTQEVQDYVTHLSESLQQEGEAAYMMELLYTIRHAVEMQWGSGSGKQLPRIVPLVQALTRSMGVVKTHEPGKGQRCLASYLVGLQPEKPLHDSADGPLAFCQPLEEAVETFLSELKHHEKHQQDLWEALWNGQGEALMWHCVPLVRRGSWTAGAAFARTCAALSAVALRPFEAGFARVEPMGVLRHEANTNYVLTVHLILELKAPGSYVAHVGEQSRSLEEGVLVFDPSYTHSMENTSQAELLVFYCHFYHPGISEVERYALLLLAQLMEMLQSSGMVKGTTLAPARGL